MADREDAPAVDGIGGFADGTDAGATFDGAIPAAGGWIDEDPEMGGIEKIGVEDGTDV